MLVFINKQVNVAAATFINQTSLKDYLVYFFDIEPIPDLLILQ
jgi:hypothetical protein